MIAGYNRLFCRCGFRGGYCEAINFDPEVKLQLLKSLSTKLCSSVAGQVNINIL